MINPNLILRTVFVTVTVADPAGGGDARDPAPLLEVSQELEQEAQSGEVELSFGVSNEGDFASQCTPAPQFSNTENLNNAPGLVQFGSEAEDFEAGGIECAFEPELDVECEQTIEQAAATGNW